MKIACFTDIHNQQCMLNLPTVLRKSAIIAAEQTVAEFGKVDLSIVGGDNFSDYPYWNRSCGLPYKNWLDLKDKLVKNFERTAEKKRVLYVSGNNDPMLGDLPTSENPPYNTCDFYHTGPMKETLGSLKSDDYYGKYAKSKGEQAGLYYLCFHYKIDGLDFFGLNVDPDEAFNSHDCSYDLNSINWLKEKLNEIDPHGNKPIFVIGHVSATVRNIKGEIFNEDMDGVRRNALVDAFKNHKNLFYLYGHIHGQRFLRNESWQGVLHFDKDGNLIDAPKGKLSDEQLNKVGFRTIHMGGLRPFVTGIKFEYFEEDGLTGMIPDDTEPKYYEATATPKVAQYLIIVTDKNGIEVSYRNAGSLEGYTPDVKPKPYRIDFL